MLKNELPQTSFEEKESFSYRVKDHAVIFSSDTYVPRKFLSFFSHMFMRLNNLSRYSRSKHINGEKFYFNTH